MNAPFDLLDLAFPGIKETARRARAWGAAWEDASTPFVTMHRGVAISHVGVLPLPLFIEGRPVRAYGIHAVCTHPDHRRRGHFRRLLTRALQACDGGPILLYTDQPHLYVPFGFRLVQEHRFVASFPPTGDQDGWRRLTPSDGRALMARVERRAPVSHVLALGSERTILAFHAVRTPLLHAHDLDLTMAARVEGATLHLLDLVGPVLPSLEEITRRFATPFERVVISFAPDRLSFPTRAEPWEPEERLMVRGAFEVEGREFAVPALGRC